MKFQYVQWSKPKWYYPTNFSICQRHEGNGQQLKQGLQDNNRNVMFAK